MKQLVLFIIAISLNNLVTAQVEFAPVGARWTMDYHQYISPFIYPQYILPKFMDCTGTEIIQGQLCKRLEGDFGCAIIAGPVYIRQEGGKVFFFNAITEDFHLLYDFDAEVGDSWTISGIPYESNNFYEEFEVTVIAIEEIALGGDILKKQTVDYYIPDYPSAQPEWSKVFIQKIGNIDQLFPRHGLCDAPYRGIRCYQDSMVTYAVSDTAIYLCSDSISIEPDCQCQDTLLIELIDSDIDVTVNELFLYPNPFTTSLHILLPPAVASKPSRIRISDIAGRVLITQDTKGKEEVVISTEGLPAGMYFVTVEAEGYRGVEKVVKFNDE